MAVDVESKIEKLTFTKILYVDSVSGNDSNTGLSLDNPVRTINEALKKIDKESEPSKRCTLINLFDGEYEAFNLMSNNGYSGRVIINGRGINTILNQDKTLTVSDGYGFNSPGFSLLFNNLIYDAKSVAVNDLHYNENFKELIFINVIFRGIVNGGDGYFTYNNIQNIIALINCTFTIEGSATYQYFIRLDNNNGDQKIILQNCYGKRPSQYSSSILTIDGCIFTDTPKLDSNYNIIDGTTGVGFYNKTINFVSKLKNFKLNNPYDLIYNNFNLNFTISGLNVSILLNNKLIKYIEDEEDLVVNLDLTDKLSENDINILSIYDYTFKIYKVYNDIYKIERDMDIYNPIDDNISLAENKVIEENIFGKMFPTDFNNDGSFIIPIKTDGKGGIKKITVKENIVDDKKFKGENIVLTNKEEVTINDETYYKFSKPFTNEIKNIKSIIIDYVD